MSQKFFEMNTDGHVISCEIAAGTREEFVEILKAYLEEFGRPTSAYYDMEAVEFEHDQITAYSSELYSEGPVSEKPIRVKMWPGINLRLLREEIVGAFVDAGFDYVSIQPITEKGNEETIFSTEFML